MTDVVLFKRRFVLSSKGGEGADAMASLAKYAALAIADMVIIGCVVYFLLDRLIWHTPAKRVRQLNTRAERIKFYFYLAIVWLGVLLCLYGAFSFLISWMPHRWGSYDDEGEWTTLAQAWSMLGAFIGSFALLSGLENTAEKISQLQFRQSRAEAFKKLINKAISEFDFICQHPPKTAIDGYVKLIEQEIYEAERTRTIDREDARVCHNLARVLRMTYAMAPIKSEPSS